MSTYSHVAHPLETKYNPNDLGSFNQKRKKARLRQMSNRIYGDDSWRSSLVSQFKHCKYLSRDFGSADIGSFLEYESK